ASAFLAQHNPLAEDAPVDRGTNALRHTIGKLLFSRGDTAGAIGALRACAQGQQALGAVGPLPLQWGADLALALHQAGRDLEAAELAECELERAHVRVAATRRDSRTDPRARRPSCRSHRAARDRGGDLGLESSPSGARA